MLVLGPTDEPAILVGNECRGMAGAGAAADAAPSCSRISACRASPATGPAAGRDPGRRGHRPGQPGRGRRLEDVRRPRDDRCAGVPRRRAAAPDRTDGFGRERDGPADRRRRRPARDQRGRAARRLRVRRLPDLGRRPAPAVRPRARDDRERGGPAPAMERHAAVLPPDAVGRAAGIARTAQPGRPADRARRPVHRRLRRLGRAQLPGRLRRGGRRRAAPTGSRTTSSAWWGPTSRPSRSGTARCASARPGARSTRSVQRHLGDPFFGIFLNPGHQIHLDEWVNSPIAPGSRDRASLRDGAAGGHHPGDRHGLLHDQHRGRPGACRCVAARDARRGLPRTRGGGSRPAGSS